MLTLNASSNFLIGFKTVYFCVCLFTVHKKEKMKNIMKIILMEQSKIEKIVINLNANQLTMISLLRFGLVVCGV
jgi:hypothetical protein